MTTPVAVSPAVLEFRRRANARRRSLAVVVNRQDELLAEVRATLATILEDLSEHYESAYRDDQYRLERIESQLAELADRVTDGEAA